MKQKKLSILYIFALLFSFLTAGFSQTVDQVQRNKEHQAVKDLLQKQMEKAKKSDKTVNKKAQSESQSLEKTTALEDRKSYFMNGNKIATEVYNYGGIGPGYGGIRGVNNVVWRTLSYIFQFTPIFAGAVPDATNPEKTLFIVSDALNEYPSAKPERNPDTGELWQFQPLPGYADPDQEDMASNPAPDKDGDGKPDSWPREWYNPTLGQYVWPGYLSQNTTNADQEVLWVMDDRDNKEFNYYPFDSDTSRRGLGIQVEGRAFQWSNALAENTIFFIYTVTNTSDKDLDSLIFGIYGDPDLGAFGTDTDNDDDWGFFIPPYSTPDVDVDNIPVYSRSMVYFWDPDGEGALGLPTGYLACKFLESPGDSDDNFDNDGDGMIDERQDDGIDNDGDWDPDVHDVGKDGVPGTFDEGEGDRQPTAGDPLDPLLPGEPNFELTDLDEVDQIGLTSFNSWTWNDDQVSNDVSMWNRMRANEQTVNNTNGYDGFGDITQDDDLVFIFGSGYISLKKGETKRISMALIMGENLDDLLTTAETVQTIYNQNYRFFKPPEKPTVRAVPGDQKVTLYWDTRAEESIDPLTGKDFEGYVIYRSTEPDFQDVQTITDGKGSSFLSEPLEAADGTSARFDVDKRPEPYTDTNANGKYDSGEPYSDVNINGEYDDSIDDWWKGYHPVPYANRGIQYFLGNNTGLRHSYVDSNNVINGQTYYYAVVAYDHGDSVKVPPSETTKKITVDPVTSVLEFDRNTVSVIPGPRSSGFVDAGVGSNNIVHESGIASGDVNLEVFEELNLQEDGQYEIFFDDSMTVKGERIPKKNFSVINENPVFDTFTLIDTNFTTLTYTNISDDEFLSVKDGSGTEYKRDVDYVLELNKGTIRRTGNSSMPNNTEFNATFRYYPVFQSLALNGEDSNPVFDGMNLLVNDDSEPGIDFETSGWTAGSKSNLTFNVIPARLGPVKRFEELGEYQIIFSSENIDTAVIAGPKRVPVNYKVRYVFQGADEPIITYLNEATRSETWDPGEGMILFKPGSAGTPQDTITWTVTIGLPTDSVNIPTDGDTLFIGTYRPFTEDDVYKINTTAPQFSAAKAKTQLDDIYVVPNPYVAFSTIEPTTKIPGQQRGERRIYFENLPPQCTIKIFNLSGNLVRTLHHDTSLESGREYWNLLSTDGFTVAYGVYIAHIDAPGVGEKIVKFALIK
ncbi:MAG: hypothetical protein H6627_02155 [Calditrichae bacterium]|nr:hypothetical protein [Calditrichota bacterium]MCB9057337.1 hypothetical protein [Calditrichia bacterium]